MISFSTMASWMLQQYKEAGAALQVSKDFTPSDMVKEFFLQDLSDEKLLEFKKYEGEIFKVNTVPGDLLYVPPAFAIVDRAVGGSPVCGYRLPVIEDVESPTRFRHLQAAISKYSNVQENKVLQAFGNVQKIISRNTASGSGGGGSKEEQEESKEQHAPDSPAGSGGSGGSGRGRGGGKGKGKGQGKGFAAALHAAWPPAPGGWTLPAPASVVLTPKTPKGGLSLGAAPGAGAPVTGTGTGAGGPALAAAAAPVDSSEKAGKKDGKKDRGEASCDDQKDRKKAKLDDHESVAD